MKLWTLQRGGRPQSQQDQVADGVGNQKGGESSGGGGQRGHPVGGRGIHIQGVVASMEETIHFLVEAAAFLVLLAGGRNFPGAPGRGGGFPGAPGGGGGFPGEQFTESLMAEGEAAFHGGSTAPLKETVKVKALDGDGGGSKDDSGRPREGKDKPKDQSDAKGGKDSKDGKFDKQDGTNGKGDQKGSTLDKPVCRYFLSDQGCKKGQKCPFPHEWKGISKQGRCWSCRSTQHMKPECPVKDPKVKKELGEEVKSKEGGKGSDGGGRPLGESTGGTTSSPPTIYTTIGRIGQRSSAASEVTSTFCQGSLYALSPPHRWSRKSRKSTSGWWSHPHLEASSLQG